MVVILVYYSSEITELTKSSSSTAVDFGSLTALLATVIIVLVFGIDREIISSARAKKDNDYVNGNSMGLIALGLGISGLVAIWLAIRTAGVLLLKYLIESNYVFMTSDVFTIISFILIANLCFTLQTTFSEIRGQKGKNENADFETISGLLKATITAVIIGLITVLPRYSDFTLLQEVNGINGYLIVVAVLISSLVVLYILWERVHVRIQKGAHNSSSMIV